jgi:hypothetical protein
MTRMFPLFAFHNLIHTTSYEDDDPVDYDGVYLETMSAVAHQHHCGRWRRSPAGTGKNPGLVQFGLRNHGLCLYAPLANAAAGHHGAAMTTEVMRYIHADDYVIVLDLAHDTARRLADGATTLTAVEDCAIKFYRGDVIRAAAYNDAVCVTRHILGPGLGMSI